MGEFPHFSVMLLTAASLIDEAQQLRLRVTAALEQGIPTRAAMAEHLSDLRNAAELLAAAHCLHQRVQRGVRDGREAVAARQKPAAMPAWHQTNSVSLTNLRRFAVETGALLFLAVAAHRERLNLLHDFYEENIATFCAVLPTLPEQLIAETAGRQDSHHSIPHA